MEANKPDMPNNELYIWLDGKFNVIDERFETVNRRFESVDKQINIIKWAMGIFEGLFVDF